MYKSQTIKLSNREDSQQMLKKKKQLRDVETKVRNCKKHVRNF